VPLDSIKKDNLHLTDSLKPNQFLKIRIVESKPDSLPLIIYHTIVKGDTPYNLSIKYGVSINEIYKQNPGSEMGIKIGDVLKIPSVNKERFDQKDSVQFQLLPQPPDTQYFYHRVERKQTKYGIATQYKLTIEELEEANHQIKDRQLQIGEELKIPAKKELSANTDFYFHKVEKQETIYKLTQLYQIKEKELVKCNPVLKDRGLQVGELIRIPKNSISDTIFVKTENLHDSAAFQISPQHEIDSTLYSRCIDPGYDKIHSYKVAFFIPLYLNTNDTIGKFIDIITKDSDGNESITTQPRTSNIEDQIYNKSEIFIQFYEGAMLAINDLKKQGLSFEIHTFDTRNDSLYVAEMLKNNNFDDYDLFIGPFFGENLNLVGDYAWEHQINIVSPLSLKSSFIDHNPYAFQVSPPFDVQMKHASEFLNDFDTKNYIVIHDGNNLNQEYISLFKRQLFSQMNKDNFNQIKYNEVFYYDARDSVLMSAFSPNIDNIVIVPSNDRAFVSDVMGKLNGYSSQYKIITFGQPRWQRFDNIELDYFHHTNTHIFSNSFIDYKNPMVDRFVNDYRFFYKGEPDKSAFQGYDITKYFLTALNKYGHDFRKCIHMHQIPLLQTDFNFVPYSDQGGYQNTAIFILEYTPDYRLIKDGRYPKK